MGIDFMPETLSCSDLIKYSNLMMKIFRRNNRGIRRMQKKKSADVSLMPCI